MFSIRPDLSVSDLASLITVFWNCISLTLTVVPVDLSFEVLEVCYLISGMPHFAFMRASGCITALITLERCLSIVSPLKVIATTLININLCYCLHLFGAPVLIIRVHIVLSYWPCVELHLHIQLGLKSCYDGKFGSYIGHYSLVDKWTWIQESSMLW